MSTPREPILLNRNGRGFRKAESPRWRHAWPLKSFRYLYGFTTGKIKVEFTIMIIMIIQLPFKKHSYRNMKFQAPPNGLNNERKVDILWSCRLPSTRQPLFGQARWYVLHKHDRSTSRTVFYCVFAHDIISYQFQFWSCPLLNAY